jgi:hypothetical protein
MARLQIAIAIDQLGNTLLGGMADETISARAWREQYSSRRWAIARRVIDVLFAWEPEHCRAAFESERERKQLPQEYWT